MFLGALESWELQILGQCFTLQMWPVFVLQFKFEFLRNDGGGDLHVIILFLHQFFANLGLLGFVRKL
jgi:hypothetical protein